MLGYFESSRMRAPDAVTVAIKLALYELTLYPPRPRSNDLISPTIQLNYSPTNHDYVRALSSRSSQSFWERLVEAIPRDRRVFVVVLVCIIYVPRLCRERERVSGTGKKEKTNEPRGKYCSRNKADKFTLTRESYVRSFPPLFFFLFMRGRCNAAKCHFYGALLTQSSRDQTRAFFVSVRRSALTRENHATRRHTRTVISWIGEV